MTQPRTLDAIWADVLNGTVITLLGLAVPAFIIWALLQGGGEAFQLGTMSRREFFQGLQALLILAGSLAVVRTGMRLLVRSVRELRDRSAHLKI